jgi:type I restriction enzyme S subunit
MSVVGKQGYKETEVGWIPVDWEATNFGTLLSGKPEYGANAAAAEFCGENSVRYIRITDIDEAGRLLETGKKYLPIEEAKDYLLTENDVLIARSGNTVGKSLLFKENMGRCAFAGYLIRFRVGERLAPEYAAHYLHSDAYWAWVKSSSKVGAQPNINSQQYQGMPLPLPCFPEQKKIAAILTAVDDKLDVIARQIEATQTLKRSLMQTLFSRGVGTQDAEGRWVPHAEFKDSELGENPPGWRTMLFGDAVLFMSNGFVGTASPYYADPDEGVLYLQSNNIRENRFDFNKRVFITLGFHESQSKSVLRRGDLLTVQSGHIGTTAVVDDSLAGTNCHALIISRPNPAVLDSQFAAYLLNFYKNCGRMDGVFVGSTIKHINVKDLKKLAVSVPPLMEQQHIAAILNGINARADVLANKQAHYQTLKRGLMQKLLSGEWRVKVEEPVA